MWGVRAAAADPVDDDRGDLIRRCRLFATRLPEAFFSHRTAALLHGLPVPPVRLEAIDMSLRAPDRAPHAAGLNGHRLAVADADVMEQDGLRLTSPARTWFDLGKVLAVPDLVAAGDRVLAGELCTRDGLGALVATHPGERGTRRLATALALLNPRSESPQESRLRAILLCGGLPEPQVNLEIRDAHGRFLARGDLVYVTERLIIEYQGDYHRDRAQWRRDMTRRASLEAAGWRVLELNADDLLSPTTLVARVRSLLAVPFR